MQGNPVGVTSSFLIPLPRTRVPHYPILTLTTAQEAEKLFMEEANRAFMLTYSGASNYTTAMKESCSRLARNGITTVHYNNGKPVSRSIESAVRMNVLTAVNHSAANITVNNCQKLGCDLVEVSAHQGARPEHAAGQGKVYSLSGTHPDYPPFSVCGLGTAKGICGINCRHSFYPYFPGSERHYTQKDLDSLEDEQVEWKGKKLGRYQAEQKLRQMERQIRHYKREAVLSKAAGIDDTAARIKLGQWQAQARQFTKETGLKRDSSREWIGVDGAQPRGLKDKDLAEKTEDAVKKLYPAEQWEGIEKNVYITKNRIPKNKQQKVIFEKEFQMAKIAADNGHVIYMLPETSNGKNPDVVMDGVVTEFKEITGGENAISYRFRESLKQGKNSFLKIDKEITSKRVKEILKGVIKGKNYEGIIYCYLSKEKRFYRWKQDDL